MRASVTSLSKKLVSTFFAATLALGLVPAAAFAEPAEDSALTGVTDRVAIGAQNESSSPEDQATSDESGAYDSATNGFQDDSVGAGSILSDGEDGTQDDVAAGDDAQTAVPAAGIINQTMPLEVVAQQESTRSYFLAQTLESTRTVPIVSANLPLDKGTSDEVAEPETPAEGDGSSEDEGGDDSDESDPGTSDDASAVTPGVSAESTVVGSFEYRGITYAVEPGGESVAVVATDYAKLPEEFIEAQTIVLPSMVTVDGADYYTVSRIADHAFAGINEVVAVAAQNGQDADAPSSMQAQAEAYVHEDDTALESSESGDVAVDAAVDITTVTIPASVVEIGDDAFTGADTLQYVVVSPDNPTYSQYDGCLYDADQTSLLLIPEGRLGAVWIAPSATSVDPEVFSHCPSVDTLVVDPDSAAYQLLAEDGFLNENGNPIALISTSEAPDQGIEPFQIDYSTAMEEVEEQLFRSDDKPELFEERNTLGASYKTITLFYNGNMNVWPAGGKRIVEGNATEGIQVSYEANSYSHFSWGYTPGTYPGNQVVALHTSNTWTNYKSLYIAPRNASAEADFTWIAGAPTAVRIGSPSATGLKSSTTFRSLTSDKIYFNGAKGGYDVFHHMNDGVDGRTQETTQKKALVVGEAFTPTLPKKTGYVFRGWYTRTNKGTTDQPEYEYTYVTGGGEKGDDPGRVPGTSTLMHYYALWAPLSHDVMLDPNDGVSYADDDLRSDEAIIWARYNEDIPSNLKYRTKDGAAIFPDNPYNEDGSLKEAEVSAGNAFNTLPGKYFERDGYLFNGYWTTKYSESSNEVIDGRTVQPKQYYSSDMSQLRKWDETDTRATRLYAHWKYKITLDLNTYDSGGSIVKSDTGASFDASLSGYVPQAEQSALIEGTMSVPVKNGGADMTLVTSYIFTAIDGAPIQLPSAVGRPGYNDTRAWGTTRGDRGTASGVITLNNGISTAYPAVGTPTDYDTGITLYADWSGKAKQYDVNLVFSYDYPATDKLYSYAAKTAEDGTNLASVKLPNKSTYDQAIDLAGLTVVLPKAVAMADNDSLVFKGFYTDRYAKYSSKDATHPLYLLQNRDTWYIDDAGTAARALRDVGDGATVTLYALWGYPEVDIVFDMQDDALTGKDLGQTNIKDKGAGVFAENLTTNDAMPRVKPLLDNYATARPGYTFNGFWTTKYTERAGATEMVNGKQVAAQQFYTQNGTCLYDPDGDGVSTWDKTSGITLYAHWKYAIYLDANAYNSDGEAVLNSTNSDFAAKLVWPNTVVIDEDRFSTEQNGYSESGTHTATVTVENLAGDAPANPAPQTVNLVRYRFDAIEGAPIQLPTASERRGYADSRGWYALDASGNKSGILQLNGDNVSNPFQSVLKPALVAKGVGSVPDEYACVLYADWSGVDANLSGKPKQYTVQLYSKYGDAGENAFAPTDAALDMQELTVTYDAPLPLAGMKEYKTGDAINYVDATKDAAGAARNLVLRGFYSAPATVVAPASGSKSYINVVSDAFSTASAKQSGQIAFREVSDDDPAMTEPIKLYAWWTYNTMDVSFDVQGGAIPVVTPGFADTGFAQKIEDVTSHGAVPDIATALSANHAKVPKRAGYTFAGYWNTRYNEKSAESIGGVTVTPRCYYVADGDDVVVNAGEGAPDMWLEYTSTTLYAHWTYDISFDKQLTNSDIATLGFDGVPTDTDDATANANTLLWQTDGDAEYAYDVYGNRYEKVPDNTSGAAGNDTVTLTARALAGSPVMLPRVYDRKAWNADAGKYIFAGYNMTDVWFTSDEKTTASELARAKDDYTAEAASWKDGLPVGVGQMDVPVSGTLPLYTDWENAKQTFYVEILFNYGYNTDGSPVDAGAAPEIDYTSQDGVVNKRVQIRYDDTFEALDWDSAWKETAQVAGEDEPYNNLDFAGVWTKPLDFRSGDTTGALQYFASDGTTNVQFRFVSEEDAVEKTRTNSAENYNIKLYAYWRQPTRGVTFNFYDTDAADADEDAGIVGSTLSDVKLTLQKGDALATKVEEPVLKGQLATIADQLRGAQPVEGATIDRYGDYVFGGFWTTPVAETTETNGGMQPLCYFVLNDAGDLVPATPTTGSDGQPDGWLTAANTRTTWQQDADTTLYAHWKYRVQFVNDATIPLDRNGNATTPDLLEVGNAGKANAAQTVAYADAVYVDARGYVTFGQEIDLPFNEKGGTDEATQAVKRVRDFSLTPSEYGFQSVGRDYTGHDFVGWTTDAPTGEVDASACLDPATKFADEPSALKPTGGVATLHANWKAREYTLRFEYSYAGADWMNAGDRLDVINGADATASITVRYDEQLTGAITPYELGGYKYTGTWGAPASGAQYYQQQLGTTGSDSAATAKAWYLPNPDSANQHLYSRYAQQDYTVTFVSWDSADTRTVQPTIEANAWETNRTATWHYGDRYTDSTAGNATTLDFAPFLPSRDTFTRHGYTFAGWYFYEDAAADHTDETARTFIYLADASGGAGASGIYRYDAASGQWQRDAKARYFDFDWKTQGELTLYAAWTPVTYQVTIYPNYQNTNAANNSPLGPFTVRYEDDLSENAAWQSVLGWNEDGTNNLEADGAPFTFHGFNRVALSADQTTGAASGWLYEGMSADLMQLPGGRFMPEEPSGAITLHVAWNALAERNVALFKGAHAESFKQNGVESDFAMLPGGYDYNDRVLLEQANWKSLTVKPGYRWLGFVEVPFSLIEGVDAPANGMTESEMRAFIDDNGLAAKVNALTSAQLAGLPLVSDPIVPGSGAAFKDYFLVAKYQLITDDYEILLDMGEKSVYEGEVVQGISTGVQVDCANTPFGYLEDADYAKDPAKYDRDRIQRVTGEFNVETPDFTLPQPTSDEYEFMGWSTTKPTAENPLPSDRQRVVAIDVKKFVDDAAATGGNQDKAKLTYYAVWREKEYTVRFVTDRTDDAGAALPNEEEVWTGVKYSDTFSFPYPATRGEGQFFTHWALREKGAVLERETFDAAEMCTMKDLLFAINHSKKYRDEATSVPLTPGLVETVYDPMTGDAINTITFDADWLDTVSATMPLYATVNVDLERGDMLTGDSYIEANTPNSTLEVVSLRYDRLDAEELNAYEAAAKTEQDPGYTSEFAFTEGELPVSSDVQLTVYAGLKFDPSYDRRADMLAHDNVGADGKLVNRAAAALRAGSVNNPLRISLLDAGRIVPKSLASAGAYVPNVTTTPVDEVQTVSSAYGFTEFGNGESARLPIYYGLLFTGDAKPIDFAALRGLGPQSDDSIPVARLFYTVARAD